MPNAFDTGKCDVEAVEAIPPGDVLADPTVADPPGPITDCPATILSAPPDAPCPDIRPTQDAPGAAAVGYGGTYDTNPPGLAFRFQKGACCDFELLMDLAVPCTVVGPEAAAAAIPWTDGASAVSFGFTRDLDTCAFDLFIDAAVHCPVIRPTFSDASLSASGSEDPGPGSIGWKDGPGRIDYYFTKDDNCDFDLTVDVLVERPVMEPAIIPRVVTSAPNDAGETTTVSYYFTRTGDVTYDLAIEVTTSATYAEFHARVTGGSDAGGYSWQRVTLVGPGNTWADSAAVPASGASNAWRAPSEDDTAIPAINVGQVIKIRKSQTYADQFEVTAWGGRQLVEPEVGPFMTDIDLELDVDTSGLTATCDEDGNITFGGSITITPTVTKTYGTQVVSVRTRDVSVSVGAVTTVP